MNKRRILIIAVSVIFLSSAGIVTFLSAQDGGGITSVETGKGAPIPEPLETRYAPDRITRTTGSAVWRVSRDLGVLVSTDGGLSWSARNEGLPIRAVYPFTVDKPPIITSLAVDPLDADRLALTTLDSVFVSGDGGLTWQKVELKDPIRANDQLTCIALSPGSPGIMAVGTSFHGFFETKDSGRVWAALSEPLTPLKLGGGSYEEIAALSYDPTAQDLIWFSLGFGKGLFAYHRTAKTVDEIELPPETGHSPLRALTVNRHSPKDDWYLEARTDDARWSRPLLTAGANPTGAEPSRPSGPWMLIERIRDQVALPADKAARMAAAADKFGIYVSSRWASGPRLQTHLGFLKAQGLNSIVLDFKDDDGYLTYDTQLEEPLRIGAVKKRFSIEEIVQTAHANGLYLIGRIVVFRDKQLYNADNFQWAAWDKPAKVPWRYLKKTVDDLTGEETAFQGEYWVDPYSEHVWDYNINIARELQDKGVDEIQFDYIRFPSDGDIGGITWRYRKPGMGKMEALESFLAKAREYLSIPISTDVYGYCGWARISNWVAQNIEMYSRYVDVIQPMFYPSHFPRDFLGNMEYLPRAKYIYEEGTKRSAYIVEGRSVIRPYVQAFRIGAETSFPAPVYTTYLLNQVHGSLEGAGSGFTLWNASNDYYMVTVPLGPIIAQGTGAEAVR
jgi:hypothetical protein